MVYNSALFFIFGLLLVISRLHMDVNYNLIGHTISELGDRVTNPYGWRYFSIALIILTIGLIPSISYIYSFFKITPWVLGSFIVEILGCIGLIVIAVYDQNTKIHIVAAFTTFILFIVGIVIIALVYTFNGEIHKESIVAIVLLLILYFGGIILVKCNIITLELHEWLVTLGLLVFMVFISGVICE